MQAMDQVTSGDAQIAYQVIRNLENQPQTLPTVEHLKKPEVQAAIVKAVEEQRRPAQLELEGVTEKPNIAAVVAKTRRRRRRARDLCRRLYWRLHSF